MSRIRVPWYSMAIAKRIVQGLQCLASVVTLAVPAAAMAAPTRHAVIIGNDLGDARDAPLRYAEDDARKVHETLRAVGGFAPERIDLLLGEDADTVMRAVVRLNEEIRASPERDETMLLVYYSGHADAHGLHLGTTTLDLGLLERLIRGSSAGIRLLVLDACRSGAITRVKGATTGPPIAARVQARPAGQGVVFLTASAATEDAQESDRLRGAFFTHYFVSGLVGAADADGDGDGDVALDEVYQYAYSGTLRATSTTYAGIQHPTYRYEFRGQGKIVLASLDRARASYGVLVVPRGRTFLVLRGDAGGPVVAEVESHAHARKLALPAGRYFLRGRGADDLVEGQVTVEPGQTHEVDASQLQVSQYARMVRKGGRRLAHGPQAGYLLATPLDGGRLCHGVQVGYPFESRHFSAVPLASWCRGGFTHAPLVATTDLVELGVRLVHAWDLPGVTLDFGMHAGAGWLLQRFVTPGRAGPRRGFVGRFGATAAVAVDLAAGVHLDLSLTGGFAVLRRDPGPRADDVWVVIPSAQLVLGLGKRF